MRRTPFSLSLVFTLVALLIVLPSAGAQAASGGLTVPVTGKAQNGPKLTGTFTVKQFVATGDPTTPIGALGTLVLTTADGKTYGMFGPQEGPGAR